MLAQQWKMGWMETAGNARTTKDGLHSVAIIPPRPATDPKQFIRPRSWEKTRIYTLKDGYKVIHNNSKKEGIWKNVWSIDGLPKIIFFAGS